MSVSDIVFQDLKLYPNPSQDVVTIQLPTALKGNTTVAVYDLIGKHIYTQRLDINTTIQVSNWQSGVYLMKFINDKATITKRFIKK